jgi:hypothetical protein
LFGTLPGVPNADWWRPSSWFLNSCIINELVNQPLLAPSERALLVLGEIVKQCCWGRHSRKMIDNTLPRGTRTRQARLYVRCVIRTRRYANAVTAPIQGELICRHWRGYWNKNEAFCRRRRYQVIVW